MSEFITPTYYAAVCVFCPKRGKFLWKLWVLMLGTKKTEAIKSHRYDSSPDRPVRETIFISLLKIKYLKSFNITIEDPIEYANK